MITFVQPGEVKKPFSFQEDGRWYSLLHGDEFAGKKHGDGAAMERSQDHFITEKNYFHFSILSEVSNK
ncbi:hypothetical protein LINPERHAP2_LOCUS21309 [Linum perenne]